MSDNAKSSNDEDAITEKTNEGEVINEEDTVTWKDLVTFHSNLHVI